MADDTPKLSRTFDRAASCTASEISELENNLVQLICKEGHKNGISLSDFPIYYEKTFRKRLDITRLGYSSLLQFLVHNPSVFRIKKSPLNGSIIIRDANKYCEDKRKVPEEIEKQIVDIMDSFLALYTDDFEKEFRKKFRKPFRAVDYGFLHNDEIILRMKGFLKFGVLGYNRAILYFDKIEYEQQKKQTITATNGPPFRICVNGFVMEAQLLPKDYSRQSRISIRISRVVKPSELYIQLSEKYDELEQLMSAINQRYNVTEHLGQEENYSFQIDDLQIGMFCVCKYNNRWHRACIASVDDLNHIKVKLIDYGMFHCVDHTNLRYLFFDFANLPAQSICVTEVALAAYENDEHDSDLVCSILEGLSLLGSHLMQVLKYTPKEHFEVKNKLAVLKCQLYREPDIESIATNAEPVSADIESILADAEPVSADAKPISALISRMNGPPFRVCMKGFVMKAQLLPKDYSRQSRISIRISRVVKPSELYIQLSEKYDELEQLMSAMNKRFKVNEHLGEERNYPFQIDDLQIGMFCVCKYNNRWYRACIASVDDLNHIKVKLIDYGMFHCVDHTNLRYLIFDFANLPAQSICVKEVALAAYENDERDSDLVCSILERLSLHSSHLMQVLKYTPKEHFEVKNKLAVLKCQLYREPDIEPILPGIESVSAGNKPVSAGTEPISALISRMVFDDVPRGTNNTTTSTNLGVSGSSYDFHHFSNGSAAYPSPTSGSMYAGYPSSSYLSQALYQPTTYPHVAPCPIPYSFFTLEYMPTNYYTQQLQNVYAHQTSLNSNADALRSPYLDNHLPSYGDTGGPINLLNDRTLQMGGHEMPAEMNSSSFSNVGGYNDGGITLDMNRLSLLVNENVDSGSSAFLNAENLELGNSGQQNIMGQASQLDMVGQENKPYMIEKSTQHDNFLRKFIGRGPQSEARSCISLDKDLVDFDPLSRLSERNERIVGLTNGRSEMSENNDFSFCSELLNEMWASTEADEALTNHSQIET